MALATSEVQISYLQLFLEIRKIYNEVQGDKKKDPPKEWTINAPKARLNHPTSTPLNLNENRQSPFIPDLIDKINSYAVENGEVYPSKSIPYTDTTSINS